jgi:hypothetical protein
MWVHKNKKTPLASAKTYSHPYIVGSYGKYNKKNSGKTRVLNDQFLINFFVVLFPFSKMSFAI